MPSELQEPKCPWRGKGWARGTRRGTPLQPLPEAQVAAKAGAGRATLALPHPTRFWGHPAFSATPFLFHLAQQGVFQCERGRGAFVAALPPQASVEDWVGYKSLSR